MQIGLQETMLRVSWKWILLYENGYPPEWNDEVFDKVMEQAENFKTNS